MANSGSTASRDRPIMTSTTVKLLHLFVPANLTSSRISSRESALLVSSLASVCQYFVSQRLSCDLLKQALLTIPLPDSFTINAVAQDDFSDVQVPDAPSQPPHTPNAGAKTSTTEAVLERQREKTKNTA